MICATSWFFSSISNRECLNHNASFKHNLFVAVTVDRSMDEHSVAERKESVTFSDSLFVSI